MDFNEPGKGKDQCDREAAMIKTRINAFVDIGNNVQTAEEYKQGKPKFIINT